MKESIQLFRLDQFDKLKRDYDFITWGTETCIFKGILKKEDIYVLKNKLNGKKLIYITALLPHFFEEKFYIFLKNLIGILGKNLEITINDWGIYYFLKNNGYLQDIKVNIGTNLYYHIKDPYTIFVKSEKNKFISIDSEFYNNFYSEFNKLDLHYPYHGLEIKYLDKFPKNIYYPYVQYSFTRACPWALYNAGETKSKLVLHCDGCPLDYYNKIVTQKLMIKGLNLKSYYVPNGQYYSIKEKFSIEDIINNINNEYITYNNFIVEENL